MKTSLSRLAFLTGLTVAAGCSTASSHSIYVPSAQFRSVSSAPTPRKSSQHAKRGAATLVEESLHARGIRFGTDGSVPALLAFTREQFAQVQADQARPVPSGRLTLLAGEADTLDLILLGVNMPEMDGYEVCAELKKDESLAAITVIFISAYGETVDKMRAFSAGGLDYITKPFHVEEVERSDEHTSELQ